MRDYVSQTKLSRCGFTLVEALIVVAILAIIGAIATPFLLNFLPNMRLKSASRDLYSAMLEAKAEALRRSENVTVLFNSPGNAFTTFVDNGNGGGVANDGIRNGTEQILASAPPLPDRVTFDPAVCGGDGVCDGVTFAGNTLVFSLRGIPNGIGTVGLRAVDSLGNTTRQRTITASIAGRIRMQ